MCASIGRAEQRAARDNTHIYFCFISSSNAAMHYIMRKIVFL